MSAEFRYVAWDRRSAGETAGTVRAGSAADARSMIESADRVVLTVEPVRSPGFLRRELAVRRATVSPADLAWLARQLATTEATGLPIRRALASIASRHEGRGLGAVVTDIGRRLDDGEGIAEAFSAHGDTLGPLAGTLVASGVAGGTLGEAFDRLARIAGTQVAVRRKVAGALTYPLVVLVISVAMTAAMLAFVVPTFSGIYASLHGTLPLPTRVLVACSHGFRRTWWAAPVVAAAGVALYRRWRTDEAAAQRIDRWKRRVPLVGPLLTKAATARVASTLGGLLSAGVGLLPALEMAADAAGLRPVAASLRRAGDAVRDGTTLTAALAGDDIWPDVLIQLVHVGEETGRLGDLLARYAGSAEAEVAADVDRLVSLVEPLMVCVIGALVGATVVTLYLPLFDMIKLVR